jgi:hypothetical protein
MYRNAICLLFRRRRPAYNVDDIFVAPSVDKFRHGPWVSLNQHMVLNALLFRLTTGNSRELLSHWQRILNYQFLLLFFCLEK